MALKNNTKGFLLTVGCLLWLSQWLMGSTVILKSDQLFFDEAINVVEAEGNVELKTNGFSIKASALSFHLDNALVTSKESVQITRGDENFNSSSLVLDLEQSQLKLEDIHIAMELPNKKGKVYVNVRELIDKSNRKMGTNARITTCPLNEPHHYLRAWKMNYQPGKRVDLFFAYWMNHYTFFPFTILPPVPVLEWLPVPFYSYHLGQRNIIWNFPTIGKKTTDGWGWFVQNTIDFRYENNKESSILLDWFETKGDRKGNIGAGLNLNLGNYDHYSTIYYYNYDFEQCSEKKQNRIYAFSQTFTFDQWLMTAKYKRLDVDERINSSGSDSYEEWSMNTTLDPNGFPLKMSLKDKSQFKQNYTSFSSSASKQGLHYTSQLSYNDNVYKSSDRQSVSSKLTHSYELKHGINVSHTFDYRKDDDTDDNIAADENLKTYTSINKRLPKDIHMRIKLDYFIDVDSDRVTNDLQSQNFLYRLPEVELSKKGELFSFKSDSLFRFGWYKEYRYSSALDELEEISLDDKSFQPNVYFFSQKFSKDVSNLPYKSRFNFNTAYEQYVFKNENKTIFEGDAQYNIAINGSLSSDINNWVRMSTNYKSRYAPEENNSPFYAFNS